MLLRVAGGDARPLEIERWATDPSEEEERLLDLCTPPVLDIGCGPGRHVRSLALRRITALGIDIAPSAVAMAHAQGAAVLERDVFAPLPGEGRWGTTLLLDGNIGIGGDPLRLLQRTHDLLRAGGKTLVELDATATGIKHVRARIEHATRSGPWFPWAEVGVGAIGALAARAGYRSTGTMLVRRRWFAWLVA